MRSEVGREALLRFVADAVIATSSPAIRRVAVDGVDGAGKTYFADELTLLLEASGQHVLRVSADDFHAPRAIRYLRGRHSPAGFYRDSYDYAAMRELLLDPLSPGGDRAYVSAIYDVDGERAIESTKKLAHEGDILIIDGIFLHRNELRSYWDYSIFLDVNFEVSIPRGASRGAGSPDPNADSNQRYIQGQKLYFSECCPWSSATLVIDNNDLDAPVVVDVERAEERARRG